MNQNALPILLILPVIVVSGVVRGRVLVQDVGRETAIQILKCKDKRGVDNLLNNWHKEDQTEDYCSVFSGMECDSVKFRYRKYYLGFPLEMEVYFGKDFSFHSLKGTGWPD